jgi:hypothetical protein
MALTWGKNYRERIAESFFICYLENEIPAVKTASGQTSLVVPAPAYIAIGECPGLLMT